MKTNTVKLSQADKAEMLADARQYLKAAGIAKPTPKQIRDQIRAEHGGTVANAAAA